MQVYERGQIINLYANFLTIDGQEAGTVENPKITIKHVDSNGVLVTDVTEVPMFFAVETLYYFKWPIPSDADLGEYVVEYEATIDGEYAEANEVIQIAEDTTDDICGDYTTADNVAAYLGVEATDIEDIWITWATRYIELYTCQKFCAATTTEKYDIDMPNEEILQLDHYPVLEVIELKDDGEVVPLTDYLVYKEEGYIKFADEFTGTELNLLQPGPFTYGRQRVEVTYRYGRTEIPKEIEWAATVLAASIATTSLKNKGTISSGEVIEEEIGEYRRRKSTDDSSTNFSNTIEESKNIDDRLVHDVFSAKNILELYRDKKMRAI